MCGIVGYVGPDEALPIVLAGLRRLEYRGYDSAGVAVLADGELAVRKRAGKLAELEAALADDPAPAGTAAVGHTRWATHGAPTDRNAHPHTDCTGRIAVIHNGIVENHAELRQQLEKSGHTLVSETDTEVVAHLLEDELGDGSLTDAVRAVVGRLRGAYALVVLAADRPDELVGVKVSSPLIVGLGDGETILASDIPAVLERTRTVVPLDEGQIARRSRRAGSRSATSKAPRCRSSPCRSTGTSRPRRRAATTSSCARRSTSSPPRSGTRSRAARSAVASCWTSSGCRTRCCATSRRCSSWRAGRRSTAASSPSTRSSTGRGCRSRSKIASEFRYRDPVLGPDTLTLAVSQSGETIDTLEAARHAARQGSHVIAVTNTVGSSLAREAEGVLYMHAGPEIGVAASKTFATQMVSQYLVALHLAQARGTMFPEEVRGVLAELDGLPAKVERAIGLEPQTLAIARELRDAHDVLFIGRHTGYPAALEGALKLKELSYQHAEGYPAGELKHGPIALVEDGVPVVAVATRCHVYPKMLSNIAEVKARGARVIAVVTEGDTEAAALADHVLEVPETTELLSPVVVTVPLQLLAYHLADLRGCDVDRPRNLAKSVTVE